MKGTINVGSKARDAISRHIARQDEEIAALRAENAELRKALEDLSHLAIGAIEEEMTVDELAATITVRVTKVIHEAHFGL